MSVDETGLIALRRQLKMTCGHYKRAMRAKLGSNERRRQLAEFDAGIRAGFVIARGLGMEQADFTQLVHDLEPRLVAQALGSIPDR
jgi:hypothetical protein